MDFIELIVDIINSIVAILCIILFFKLWGATNDIRKIRNEICKDVPAQKTANPTVGKSAAPMQENTEFTVGEWVTTKDNLDRVMYIDRINNIGEFVCKTPDGNVVGSFKDTELISAR